MFRIIITSIVLLLIQIAPSKSSFLDPIQLEAVNAVNAYLNNIEHMEGDFIFRNCFRTVWIKIGDLDRVVILRC